MEKNIVIFGPPHVGKSTLAGYMYAKLNPNFNLKNYISECKRSLGDAYHKDEKFSYIVDTSENERRRLNIKTESTSKYMHTTRIEMDNKQLLIIDTPGAQRRNSERIKGIYFGDIGVFMIELSKLLNHDFSDRDILNKFFTPMFLWCKLRNMKGLVIVVSKMDDGDFSSDFSEGSFNKAVEIIRKILSPIVAQDSIDIIPISIDVESEKDHNIFSRSTKMSWYSGLTFIDKFKKIYEKVSSDNNIDKSLFICLEKYFDKEKVWRGKILKGDLKNGSAVKITPVKYERIGYTTIIAKVKNIRRDKGEDTEIAENKSVVGIDLHDIKIYDKRIQKNEFITLKTSCIVDPDVPLLMGNILKFEISSEKVDNFHFLEPIIIIWFGKFVTSYVVNKMKNNDTWVITLELFDLKASLPLDHNGKLLFDKFLIKIKNKFVTASLKEIGVPQALSLSIDDISTKKDFNDDYFKDFKYERLANELKFTCDNRFTDLIIRIRKFYDIKDISSNIALQIKEVKYE